MISASLRLPAPPLAGVPWSEGGVDQSWWAHGAGLRGRGRECGVLDELVSAIRRGESRSLVLRGEPGIGKTALLKYLLESASGTTVVRAAGVESEMKLAFATLHQLCGPLLDGLQALPAPQRQALEVVFGECEGTPPDRFIRPCFSRFCCES